MLALMCTVIFIAAAAYCGLALAMTMRGRGAQIAALLRDYRALQDHRTFSVRLTAAAPLGTVSACKPRRVARRAVRRVEAGRCDLQQRAAA